MAAKQTILVVDDEPGMVDFITMNLELEGFRVVSAPDGYGALSKLTREMPDLIILDIIMPTKDGFTVCEELKKDPKLRKIPVMLLTSFAVRMAETTTSAAQAMITEAEDYVDKPVSPDQLFERVERLLKR